MWGDLNTWDPWTWMRDRYPDVRVIETELPDRVQGCVDPERRIIWIAHDLTNVERRCVLAYELGQLDQGPMPEDPYAARARQRAAEEWAAQMLISTDALLAAIATSYDLSEIAAFLDVDVQTLRTRCRCLTDVEQDLFMETMQGNDLQKTGLSEP